MQSLAKVSCPLCRKENGNFLGGILVAMTHPLGKKRKIPDAALAQFQSS